MLYVVMNTKEGVEVVAKDVAKEALESNNISLSYHWDNIINKRLSNFNRYNLLLLNTREYFSLMKAYSLESTKMVIMKSPPVKS